MPSTEENELIFILNYNFIRYPNTKDNLIIFRIPKNHRFPLTTREFLEVSATTTLEPPLMRIARLLIILPRRSSDFGFKRVRTTIIVSRNRNNTLLIRS